LKHKIDIFANQIKTMNNTINIRIASNIIIQK